MKVVPRGKVRTTGMTLLVACHEGNGRLIVADPRLFSLPAMHALTVLVLNIGSGKASQVVLGGEGNDHVRRQLLVIDDDIFIHLIRDLPARLTEKFHLRPATIIGRHVTDEAVIDNAEAVLLQISDAFLQVRIEMRRRH